MGRDVLDTVTGIVTAFVGLAIISVILSRNANTVGVLKAASSGIAADITAATSPVTGGGGGFGGFGMPTMGGFYTPGVTS